MTTPIRRLPKNALFTTCERCGHETLFADMTLGLPHFPTFALHALCPACFADESLAYDDAQPARDAAPKALDFAPLAEIMRTWPEPLRESMAGWLADACNRAGITNRRQRLALQAELSALFGE